MSNNEEKITAPYGSWKSPLTADLVAGFDKRLGGIAFDEEGHVIWLEGRPTEAGRFVLVREATHLGSSKEDITPANFNVRTLVHEYGGGAFIVYEDMIIFSNYTDQRLYKQSIKGDRSPIALTPDYGGPIVRYADGVVDIHFSRYITVMEDHRQKGREPVTTIVFVRLNGKDIKEPGVLVSGNDFYSFPRLSLDGEKIAWIEWSHPNMPWDKAELWVGYFSTNGEIVKRICIAGQDPNMIESPTEPKWSSRGYGRAYRERLTGSWGVVDVDDCCSCAEFLITTGLVDEHRVCIQGKSAGGFTTLSALVFRDTFKAGSSWFGNADLSLFNAHTHKFESHQMNHLVGDNESLLFQRSPINSLDKLSCPVIIFQGLEDKVVPPEISQKIYKAMKAKGLPVALIEYEGEQHGFRKGFKKKFIEDKEQVLKVKEGIWGIEKTSEPKKGISCSSKAENMKFTLEQQMVFFARLVGGFNVADDITPVHIDNFD